MDIVKIRNKKNGAVKEVKKSLAGDYIGTNEWELVEKSAEKKSPIQPHDRSESKKKFTDSRSSKWNIKPIQI